MDCWSYLGAKFASKTAQDVPTKQLYLIELVWGPAWGGLGVLFGRFWAALEASWAGLGAILADLGPVLSRLGRFGNDKKNSYISYSWFGDPLGLS